MKTIIAWFAVSISIAFAMATPALAQTLIPHYTSTVSGNCGGATPPCVLTFAPVNSPTGAALLVQKVSCLMVSTNAYSGFTYLSKSNNPEIQEYFGATPFVSTFGALPLTTIAESTVFFVQPNASPTVTINFNGPNQFLLGGPTCTVTGILE
jgi:hypothetical protein